jgi:hypothetical protein
VDVITRADFVDLTVSQYCMGAAHTPSIGCAAEDKVNGENNTERRPWKWTDGGESRSAEGSAAK